MNIEKIDDELYKARFILPKVGNFTKIWEIWNKIRNNPDLLKEAVQVKRDKFDERDIVKGLAISDSLLIDYKIANKEAYKELINLIYTNTDIARLVVNGYSNGGYSFLLMSLWNHNLKLTEEQKRFAVNEAMNKIGTVKWKQNEEKYTKELEDMGITDEDITYINIDGCMHYIGKKTASKYMNYALLELSTAQAHGKGEYDIRYHILRNPNWTIEEKQKLVFDFYEDDEVYDEYLEQWEWGIVNDSENYKGHSLPQIDRGLLYEYSYDELLEFYGNKETTDRIWEEIKFCQKMHELRPQTWELEFKNNKKTKSNM